MCIRNRTQLQSAYFPLYIAVHLGSQVSLGGTLSSVQLVYTSGVSSSTPPLLRSVMREIAEDTSPFRMRAAKRRFSFDVVVPHCYLSPSIEILKFSVPNL